MAKLTVVCGPMCSGKSDMLMSLLSAKDVEERITGKGALALKVTTDVRDKGYSSRNGKEYHRVFPLDLHVIDYWNRHHRDCSCVTIDEVQLIDDWVIQQDVLWLVRDALKKDVDVYVFGLDTDFRGAPFDIMSTLMAEADEVVKTVAVCSRCGKPATRTQRLIAGEPAPVDSDTIVVEEKGNSEVKYEPRCRECHEVPGRGY